MSHRWADLRRIHNTNKKPGKPFDLPGYTHPNTKRDIVIGSSFIRMSSSLTNPHYGEDITHKPPELKQEIVNVVCEKFAIMVYPIDKLMLIIQLTLNHRN